MDKQPASVPMNTGRNNGSRTSKNNAPPIRVLLISYHFPPLNVISSLRAEGFARHLPEHGIEVTVLTMRWEQDASGQWMWHPRGTPISEGIEGKARVIRIPRINARFQRFLEQGLRTPVLSKIIALFSHLLGHFSLNIIYSHYAFKNFLRQHLKSHHYDVVVTTSPPESHIALGAWLKKKYNIAFVADYRDLHDTRPLMPGTKASLSERLLLLLKHLHHRRWMSHCDLGVSVSRPCVELLSTFTRVPHAVEIRNGYHPHKIDPDASVRQDVFRVTYAGRIYPWQDVDPFIQAYRTFTDRLSPEEIQQTELKFFGCQDARQIEKLQAAAFVSPIEIHARRIPADVMYRYIGESSVLLVFDIAQLGGYTGKLMDYMGCRRNVLLIPSDNGVMAELVQASGIGMATSDPTRAADQLLTWFRQWQKQGRPHFKGNDEVIAQGSRAAQTAILAKAITALVNGRRDHMA